MKVLSLVFCATALSAFADWKVLRAEGLAAEIAVDFEIKSQRIDLNGDGTMEVVSTEKNGDMGFALKISKPVVGAVAQLGHETAPPVWRCDIEIRSTGKPTLRLLDALRAQLSGSDRYDSPLQIGAPYSGFCTSGSPDVTGPSIYVARGVGLVFDASSGTITGECFDLMLIVDGPMKSLRAYFSVPGGYGGRSPAQRARSDWRDSRTKK